MDSNQEPIGFKSDAPIVLSLDTVRDAKRAAKKAASEGRRDVFRSTDGKAAA